MTRTDTPTPFAEGQRNADILTAAPSLVSLALDYARTAGRFDEVVDTIREATEGLPRLRARATALLAELARLRAAIREAGGTIDEADDLPACERDLARASRGAAADATRRALGLAS